MPFNALGLLRLAPLINSTASLTFAHDHDLFFRIFSHPDCKDKANTLIPPWMGVYMPRGLKRIIWFYLGTFILALANILTVGPEDSTSWYWLGLVFTIGHVAIFGKQAVGLLNSMKDDGSKGSGTADMAAWVDMNVYRTLLVDIPGWLCYLTAALSFVKV